MDKYTVMKVKQYLEAKGMYDDNVCKKIELRNEGNNFQLTKHIQGMIYSLLSAQTVWANIEKNISSIDELFFNYDPEEIKKHDYQYFVDGLAKLRCRSILTNKQMKSLKKNIETMEMIVSDYGSMDEFVTSAPLLDVVHRLSAPSSKYKLKQIGDALACEYLKNVGVDCTKPDVHLTRILGAERLGVSSRVKATNEEVINAMKKLSEETGLWMAQLDYIFWCYCATGKGEICTANPDCRHCVIRDECRKWKNGQ